MDLRGHIVPVLVLFAACSGAGSPGDTASATSAGEATGSESETDAGTDGPPTSGGDTDAGLCGNGTLDADELCDGAELGGATCAALNPAFTGGDLVCAANCGSFDVSGCTLAPGAALVVFNEVTSKGVAEGPYAELGDAIELFNAGTADAALDGWKISDDATFPADKTYVFPPGTTLGPGAFLVLVELDDLTMMGDFPFGISSSNTETLTLADADGTVMDELVVAGPDAERSYCRLPDGVGPWTPCDPTFGATNHELTAICGDGVVQTGEACDGAVLGGQTCASLGFEGGTLACDEGCALDTSACDSSEDVAINEVESGDDKIELYNPNANAIDLSGWILTDDVIDADYDPAADTEKLVFPAMTSLASKQFLVIAKGSGPGQHLFGLSAGGDQVSLLRPDLTVVNQISYGADEAAVSLCRLPDGPGGTPTAGCTPTFGAANQGP